MITVEEERNNFKTLKNEVLSQMLARRTQTGNEIINGGYLSDYDFKMKIDLWKSLSTEIDRLLSEGKK